MTEQDIMREKNGLPKEKKLSATIETCYCNSDSLILQGETWQTEGDCGGFQLEIYNLDVDQRLTAKFNGVTFHMTKEAAEAEAFKINGGAGQLGKSVNSKTETEPKRVQTGNKGDTEMAKRITKYAGPLEAPSVQRMLARIQKRTADNPLKDKELKGQYLKRIARRLGFAGKVAMEQREKEGLVFFGKAVKA